MVVFAVLFTILAEPTSEQLTLLKAFRAEFVAIAPGKRGFPTTFEMGTPSEGSQPKKISITYSFEVSKYEVAQNLWTSVMGNNPSRWKGPRNSVEMVSFPEATAFCRTVTALMRSADLIQPDAEIRLPNEMEWEYIARAGTKTRYSFGDDVRKLDDHAWSTRNAAGNDPPVGAKKPNPWGLYDIHGYLWEWCTVSSVSPRKDDRQQDTRQVLRGGSWKDPAEKLTSSYRRMADAQLRDDAVGFRCVLARIKKTKQED